jgi:glycine C-acetyltransferase
LLSLYNAYGNRRIEKTGATENQTRDKAKLWENVDKLQNGLKDRGFNIGDTNTCVTPVMMQGTPVEATLLVKDLRENYVYLLVVVYPVIPKGMIL